MVFVEPEDYATNLEIWQSANFRRGPYATNESSVRQFTAICDCPFCGSIATHFIQKYGKNIVRRECVNCGKSWNQWS